MVLGSIHGTEIGTWTIWSRIRESWSLSSWIYFLLLVNQLLVFLDSHHRRIVPAGDSDENHCATGIAILVIMVVVSVMLRGGSGNITADKEVV